MYNKEKTSADLANERESCSTSSFFAYTVTLTGSSSANGALPVGGRVVFPRAGRAGVGASTASSRNSRCISGENVQAAC